MGVANSGNNVLVDAAGVTLAGFTNAAASNIKVQDATNYTITTGAVGSNANGGIQLTKASGSFATLDSRHTYVVSFANIAGGVPTDTAVSNMALSIKGAKLVLTGGAAGSAETFIPLVGDAQTEIVYRSTGTTWNSIHPGVNLVGSTLFFEAGGDGHLGRHPSATVKNPNLIFRSTSNADFLLGGNQAWGTDSKPSAMDGFRFISVNGNSLISMFSWSNPLPGQLANNAFFVCKDWTYDVAAVGTRPTALLRSYRRTTFTAAAGSYWGAVSITPTYLHIDLKTSLSATGVLDSGYTYLRTVNYNATGVSGADDTHDLLTLRFKPTITDTVGGKLADCSIVVRNTNANFSLSNAIGTYRSSLAASGVTDTTGQMVITEPVTKNYTSNASHRTDSVVIRNRVKTSAWHKWWEAGTKLIPIADSRNGTGGTAPETYAATEYVVSYRRAGSVFSSGALDMSAPQLPSVALSTDSNYNGALSTTGLTISYASGVTTISATTGTYTLDQVYKSVIDYHATADSNETVTVVPVTQDTGDLTFGHNLILSFGPDVIVSAGALCKTIVTTQALPVNYTLAPGMTVSGTVNQDDPVGMTSVNITSLVYNTNSDLLVTMTNCNIGTIANTGTGTVTVNMIGGSATAGTNVLLRTQIAVTNTDPQGFGTTWVLGWITTPNYTGRNPALPPASWTGWNQSSGTGNSTQVTLAPTTEYQLFLRIPGYYAPIGPIATIDTTTQTSVSLPVIVDTDITGTNLWPQTTAHMTQAAKFAYDYGDQVVEYNNVTGATEYISFLAAYRALELIAKDPAMAYQLVQPLYVNGTKDGFTLPRNNQLKARMSDASTGGGILQADISYADNQAKAFDRFLANPQNAGNHLLIPQATAGVSARTVADIRSGLALEASVQSRASQTSLNTLATINQTEHDATQAAIATIPAAPTAATITSAVRADLERTGGMLDTVPTLSEVEASTVLAKQSGFTGLATATNVTNAQTAIVGEVNANETKIDAVQADTAAIKAKTDALVNTVAPTAAQIRTELETSGSKLDTAAKKSKAAWVNTL